LGVEAVAELVRWEYQLRWSRGDCPRRGEYLTRFPQLEREIGDLLPVAKCRHCGNEGFRLEAEDAEAVTCPHCGLRLTVGGGIDGNRGLAATPLLCPPGQAAGLTRMGPVSPGTPLAVRGRDARALPSSWPRRLGRYEVGEEIGQGGMGAVLRARDPELNRHLAIKVLKPSLRDHPELVHRFLEEAQITGQLQHPGIVPVHDLGLGPDGLPFLVMKWIRGQTLQELLDARGSVQEDLASWVRVFEQVCQAVGFAHSKGVIHRDLKPSNIMVGRFGEVQVMDWGLAKVLTSGRARRSGQAQAQGEDSAVETVPERVEGHWTRGVLGTWGFMPPEQANGDWRRVDPRSDVFALGGILCVILTGQPPYSGQAAVVAARAQQGDVAEAFRRLDACGAEGQLVVLAKECLCPEPTGRPWDAGEVALRVGKYHRSVQERLLHAERMRAALQARAEEATVTASVEEALLSAEARAQAVRLSPLHLGVFVALCGFVVAFLIVLALLLLPR
jgi:serine/threonine-protein kinase